MRVDIGETPSNVQYIPRNMHTVFALLCFVVVIHWLIFPYPSGLLHWHCGNLTIAPVPAKQPRWIWINTSCEFIINDCITTTKQSTTKPCAYFLGYTVISHNNNARSQWWRPSAHVLHEEKPRSYIDLVSICNTHILKYMTSKSVWCSICLINNIMPTINKIQQRRWDLIIDMNIPSMLKNSDPCTIYI